MGKLESARNLVFLIDDSQQIEKDKQYQEQVQFIIFVAKLNIIFYMEGFNSQSTPFKLEIKQNNPHKPVRILAISDTHFNHQNIKYQQWPQADIFIHCGDFTLQSGKEQFSNFRKFISKLPYKHKIVIPGNHDFGLERTQARYDQLAGSWKIPKDKRLNPSEQIEKLKKVCTLLYHQSVIVEGVKIFGTPHVWFGYNQAFTLNQAESENIWARADPSVDIIITHIPPHGILDRVQKDKKMVSTGCPRLLKAIQRLQPQLHIFGHIHQSYGKLTIEKTTFLNVCYLNESYSPTNKPIVTEIIPKSLKNIKK